MSKINSWDNVKMCLRDAHRKHLAKLKGKLKDKARRRRRQRNG